MKPLLFFALCKYSIELIKTDNQLILSKELKINVLVELGSQPK